MGTARDDLRHEKRISVYEGFSWVIEDEIPKHAGCFATPYITTDADATAKKQPGQPAALLRGVSKARLLAMSERRDGIGHMVWKVPREAWWQTDSHREEVRRTADLLEAGLE